MSHENRSIGSKVIAGTHTHTHTHTHTRTRAHAHTHAYRHENFFAQNPQMSVPKVLKHVFKHFLFQKYFSPLQSFLFEEAIKF